jgi:hypothetical protein
MSHYFGLDEIKEKLIIISGLALSGEEFCKRYRMGSEEHHNTYNINDYTKLTKLIVSNNIIEIAVKIRCLVDDLKSQNITVDFGSEIKMYNTGRCADGKSKDRHFRFICNKVIHADKFNLDFIGSKAYHLNMVWWSGLITLSGEYNGKRWEFFFSVLDWSDQIVHFLKSTEEEINKSQLNSRDLQIHS